MNRPQTNWKTLFWDLDGTITDPRRGIIDSYIEMLREFSIQPPPESELLWVIGPPLRGCISQLLNTTDGKKIEEAVTRYRHWYVQEGLMYRDTPYEGIREILTKAKSSGYRMFIATAKAHSYARLILQHWGLEEFFENIHGSELDGTRSNKAELLAWMLEHYDIKADTSIVMIGDRHHDAIAAQANNLTSLGVGYGYGSKHELVHEAKVNYYCETIKDLAAILTK